MMPKIQINTTEYYYELHGAGQPLVLIAGYGCDHAFWMPVLGELSKQFQVLIFDNRGSGQTVDAGEPLTARLLADDIMQMTAELGLQKPHIIGHSMGGAIAQTIAATYPDSINKLILLNTTAKCRLAMLQAFQSLLQMRIDGIAFDVIFAAAIPWLFGDRFLQNPELIAIFKESILRNPYAQSIEGQARQFALLRRFDGEQQLTTIQADTLVVCGDQDVVALVSEAGWLAQHIAKAELHALNCGHVSVGEVPSDLVEMMRDFLR